MRYLFLIGLCVVLGLSPIEAKKADEHNEKLSRIQAQIQKNLLRIKEKKRKQYRVMKDIGALNRDIKYTNVLLKRANRNLNKTYQKAVKANQELTQVKDEYTHQSNVFSARLRQIYKNQNLGVLELLFTSRDISTIFDYTYYFDKLVKADIQMIDDINRKYQDLVAKKLQIDKEKKKIVGIKLGISSKKKKLSRAKTKKKRLVASIKREIREVERKNRELAKVSREITALIQRQKKWGSTVLGTGSFRKPTRGWYSSKFGYRRHPISKRVRFHNGLDMAAPRGTQIRAADSGRIVFAGRWGGYGNATIIDHGRGMTTVYAHQSRILVRKGQSVKKGQLIGYVGSTGYSTGPHLHFEIRKNGKPINPYPYIVGKRRKTY